MNKFDSLYAKKLEERINISMRKLGTLKKKRFSYWRKNKDTDEYRQLQTEIEELQNDLCCRMLFLIQLQSDLLELKNQQGE